MDFSVLALIVAVVVAARGWGLPARLDALQEELAQRLADQKKLQEELLRLQAQVNRLTETTAKPLATARPTAPPVAPPAVRPGPIGPQPVAPGPAPLTPPAPRPVPTLTPEPAPAPLPIAASIAVVKPTMSPVGPPPPIPQPIATPLPAARPVALPMPTPLPVAATMAVPPPVVPPVAPPPPAPPRRPPPPPVPTGPSWWERASTVLLENWTGILGAVVLVTGVGFLGIYAALRLAPPFRFLMICAFSGGLLGVRFALRNKAFARQLNGWLLSSAAAIFLFACVASVSIPGLQWASPPLDYLLLLAGVSANLWLAWRASRQDVATLHGVLSLVALAVLPPTGLTLAAGAGVTAFSIAITYRQLWKYQLLLSIASFFAFHLYWHQQLAVISGPLRLVAMGLVLLVGVAAAVVQYRSVYAKRQFEPLLFAAHLLNWTCMGINLYLYSSGSIWKTIPLALGSLLTFWAGRRAKQLGIGWLFQTDTIIALMLALATAFSLQGWHATNPVILLFMLLEALLVALVMARQREALVYRVALSGACLAGAGLLLLAGNKLASSPPTTLYRDALVLALAGGAGLAFGRFIFKQPLLDDELAETVTPKRYDSATPAQSHRNLLGGFTSLAGLLQAGAGVLLARVLFAWQDAPVWLLLAGLLALAGGALGLAIWLRTTGRTPEWVRQQQLLLAQGLVLLAGFGLHELGLAWAVVLGLLCAENLAVALLALRQREALLYRVTLSGAWLAGTSLLLIASATIENGLPRELYRDALVLTLAGWVGLAFARRAFGQLRLLLAVPFNASHAFQAFALADNRWLGGFAGLAGLLQVGAGLLLTRVLFAWQTAPVGLLLGALLALGGAALGLAAWLRTSPPVPAWVRRQQLVLGQFFAMLAVLGLHETGLSWPVVVGILYAENLAVALLTARRRETLLYHLTLASAYLSGAVLLLFAGNAMSGEHPPILYRDALLLALAGWAGVLFTQLAHRELLRPALGEATTQPATNETERDLLSGFAGLAGVLQAGAGVLLARVLFAWQGTPVGLLLVGLLGLAGAALGLSSWVRAQGVSPSWVRRQQLVLGQFFVVLAVFGLHEAGLSWPAVYITLYAENLLVALLLNGRDEDTLLRIQTYLLVLQAAALPLLVRYSAPHTLGLLPRAALLAGAALLTAGYQIRQRLLPTASRELAVIQLSAALRISALGLGAGWLLLSAGALVYDQSWAAWAMVALMGSLLFLRQRVAAPGLWAGLVLAAMGYMVLQWGHVLAPPPGVVFSPGYVLLYLLPTLAVPVVSVRASWWPAGGRFVRWPWLYLLGLHLVVALVAAVPNGHVAYLAVGLLALAGLAFVGAQQWRGRLPDEPAVLRAGLPDRFLLHVGYVLLGGGLATHLGLLALNETFFGQPAEYFTAALVFGIVAGVAIARPPATAPVYNSWRLIQPWLPEAALLFGTATLWHNIRTPWLPLVWVSAALALGYGAVQIPVRLRRLGVYGRLYYWLAAGMAGVASLLYLEPSQILAPAWWEITAAVCLLFGYVWQSLANDQIPFAGLSPAWDMLARPPRRVLEAWLLYPAFLALSLLLIQSFDRSVLTVLLMLEVVAIFSTSLLLRRQDLRYLSLAGMLACLVRLVFFDLSRSGTITRAVVFIFMGLLLLGMNALYARFKARFAPEEPEPLPAE